MSARACYGQSLATGRVIELGEAVGVIAAQSIGEPGTQLTMRTFHTGGIVGEDITHGLPRVVELFEARTPKGAAVLARASGVVAHRRGRDRAPRHGRRRRRQRGEPTPSRRAPTSRSPSGQEVQAGDALVEGPKDPKELLEIKGIRETQQYLVEEVQKVYRDQGVSIHDKHIELIVRQMLRRVLVAEPGDAPFLPGERVDSQRYANVNRELVQQGKRPAEGRPELMGITKASLATDSWLSAASFQETTRVLTEAAIEGTLGPALRAEGEHHHRQADPGRDRDRALPQRRGRDPRSRSGCRSGPRISPSPGRRISRPGFATSRARPSAATPKATARTCTTRELTPRRPSTRRGIGAGEAALDSAELTEGEGPI